VNRGLSEYEYRSFADSSVSEPEHIWADRIKRVTSAGKQPVAPASHERRMIEMRLSTTPNPCRVAPKKTERGHINEKPQGQYDLNLKHDHTALAGSECSGRMSEGHDSQRGRSEYVTAMTHVGNRRTLRQGRD
jgi:hypothetical protein